MTLPLEFEGVPGIKVKGPYLVYPDARDIYLPGHKLVRLVPRSYQIFDVLAFDVGKTSDQIIEEVYKANLNKYYENKRKNNKFNNPEPKKMTPANLHTHIFLLRDKLGYNAIINTHGHYRLNISPA